MQDQHEPVADRVALEAFADGPSNRATLCDVSATNSPNTSSCMLRGYLKAARTKFQKALKQDPDNPTVLNNIKLLNSSSKISLR